MTRSCCYYNLFSLLFFLSSWTIFLREENQSVCSISRGVHPTQCWCYLCLEPLWRKITTSSDFVFPTVVALKAETNLGATLCYWHSYPTGCKSGKYSINSIFPAAVWISFSFWWKCISWKQREEAKQGGSGSVSKPSSQRWCARERNFVNNIVFLLLDKFSEWHQQKIALSSAVIQ